METIGAHSRPFEKVLSRVRRCVEDYNMIEPHDRVAVGLSGGKDSITLLIALKKLSRFYPIPFEVAAVTIDAGFGADHGALRTFCAELGVPLFLKEADIKQIVFDIRKESNPCALCAKMRRGALNDLARENGFFKVALGHNLDDAAETFLMSLIYEGRLHCFSPVSYLDRTGITVVRPLLYIYEKEIRSLSRRLAYPLVKNPCPANGNTVRQEAKELLLQLEHTHPGLRGRIIGAMQRGALDGWNPREN